MVTHELPAGRTLDADRRQQLVAYVDQVQRATVPELSRRFGVSEATIRRDLVQLSRRGLLERAHGGAVPRRFRHGEAFPEPPILDRAALLTEEKRRIGRAAAETVEDGETILITGGTTTAHVVPHLAGRVGLTVITNNLNIANLLAPLPQITVVMIGGVLRHSELSLLGAITEDGLRNLRAQRLFIGSSAIAVDYGLSADDLAEVQTDRAIMAVCRHITVLADHSKFGRVRTVRVIPMERIDCVVTDRGTEAEHLAALRELGVHVIVA